MSFSQKIRQISKCETVSQYVDEVSNSHPLSSHLMDGHSLLEWQFNGDTIHHCCTIINPPRLFILNKSNDLEYIQTLLFVKNHYVSVETEVGYERIETQEVAYRKGMVRPDTESYFDSHFRLYSGKSQLFKFHIEKSSEISKLLESRMKKLIEYKTILSSFLKE